MAFEFNIVPKENLPSVDRKVIVTNIHIDTVNRRLTIGGHIFLVDINGDTFSSPEYISNKSLVLDTGVGQELSEEQADRLALEQEAVELLDKDKILQSIVNILEDNKLKVI